MICWLVWMLLRTDRPMRIAISFVNYLSIFKPLKLWSRITLCFASQTNRCFTSVEDENFRQWANYFRRFNYLNRFIFVSIKRCAVTNTHHCLINMLNVSFIYFTSSSYKIHTSAKFWRLELITLNQPVSSEFLPSRHRFC